MPQDAAMKVKPSLFSVIQDSVSQLEISLPEALTVESVSNNWKLIRERLNCSKDFIVHAEHLKICDEAGIAFLVALQKKQINSNKKFSIVHLTPAFQDQINQILGKGEPGTQQLGNHHFNLALGVGHAAVNVLESVRENIIFIGASISQTMVGLLHPSRLRWKDFWRVAENVGPDALLIIALIGFLIGLITAFQAAIPMRQFGVEIYIANLVGISLVREMGPLMTAVILAGRTASSFSAEIGTMKINQEIDALKTMGLKPVFFLVVPRILATTCMTPLLNIFLIFFGLVGCFVVMQSLGFSLDVYIRQLQQIIHMKDFIGGMIKAFVFGILIAGVGCLHGLKTNMGASAVGYSTTRAVVSCIILIIVVDGIFACLYYVLGV